MTVADLGLSARFPSASAGQLAPAVAAVLARVLTFNGGGDTLDGGSSQAARVAAKVAADIDDLLAELDAITDQFQSTRLLHQAFPNLGKPAFTRPSVAATAANRGPFLPLTRGLRVVRAGWPP